MPRSSPQLTHHSQPRHSDVDDTQRVNNGATRLRKSLNLPDTQLAHVVVLPSSPLMSTLYWRRRHGRDFNGRAADYLPATGATNNYRAE